MKLFIYKTLIVIFFVYILFEITIGQKLNKIENKIENLTSKQGRDEIIIKLKEEIKNANAKENYFTIEERELIKTFINKIQKELSLGKNQ